MTCILHIFRIQTLTAVVVSGSLGSAPALGELAVNQNEGYCLTGGHIVQLVVWDCRRSYSMVSKVDVVSQHFLQTSDGCYVYNVRN